MRPLALFAALAWWPLCAAQAQTSVSALLETARGQEKAGDYAAAEQTYREALALAPGDLETLKRLGVLEQTELKFDASIQLFQQVLARDAQYSGVNFYLGVSYFGKNDLGAAIDSFQRELKTAKPHPRCRYYLAMALRASGQPDEAIAQLNKSVEENPKDADALYELARIYKDGSLRAVERLKALDPDSFQLHALMGEMQADQEHYADAIREYQAALAKRPDAQGIHYAIGVAYWAQRQWEPAEQEFQLARKENPGDALTNLYLGDIAVQQRRFSDAVGYLQTAQAEQPALHQVHLLLAQCYKAQKEPGKAKTELLAAIAAEPDAAQPHYLLAQVYRELNDAQASAAELAEFQRLSAQEEQKNLPHKARN
jgi:tetratricopeptide (TPR) repeat protein